MPHRLRKLCSFSFAEFQASILVFYIITKDLSLNSNSEEVTEGMYLVQVCLSLQLLLWVFGIFWRLAALKVSKKSSSDKNIWNPRKGSLATVQLITLFHMGKTVLIFEWTLWTRLLCRLRGLAVYGRWESIVFGVLWGAGTVCGTWESILHWFDVCRTVHRNILL